VDDSSIVAVAGDATEDAVLRAAGIDHAAALVAAVNEDAANSFIVLSARALKPSLFIVARARSSESIDKLHRAGADRVVNPQSIGGSRMAAFVLRPHVAEFVDVVMHERSMEFRMQEVELTDASPLSGRSLRDANLRQATNVLVLAVRQPDGSFVANPDPATVLSSKDVIIAVGTDDDLRRLVAYCG
jgi:voltage-gated potassium channel